MPSYVTPKRATEYIFYISLVSQANTKIFQANPTIAAGDFKVSIDGGALANPATLPAVTPASSKLVKITLSIAEMTGDNISVVCSDASGAEWCDLTINIQTSVRQVDDLATQASVDTIDNFLDTEIAAIITTLGTPAGASMSVDIAAIEAQTDDIGAAGAGLTAVPWNAVWDAQVESEVADALIVYNLDHLVGSSSTDGDVAANSIIAKIVSKGVVADFTDFNNDTDSLEAIRDRGDAAWTTGAGGLDAAGVRAAVGLASANLDTQLNAIDDFLDTEVAAIKTVTDQLVAAQAEPTGVPAANETPLEKLGFMFAALRNKLTVSATKKIFFDDAGAAIWEKDLSDDGTTYTETEGNAP